MQIVPTALVLAIIATTATSTAGQKLLRSSPPSPPTTTTRNLVNDDSRNGRKESQNWQHRHLNEEDEEEELQAYDYIMETVLSSQGQIDSDDPHDIYDNFLFTLLDELNDMKVTAEVQFGCDNECFAAAQTSVEEDYMKETIVNSVGSNSHLDPQILINLVEYDAYDEPFVDFTSSPPQQEAYKAISNSIVSGWTDVRSKYAEYSSTVKDWTNVMNARAEATLSSLINQGLSDEENFKTVQLSLTEEFIHVGFANDWMDGYIAFNNEVNTQELLSLTNAKDVLSISSDTYKAEPPAENKSWMGVFMASFELFKSYSGFIGPFGDLIDVVFANTEFFYKTTKELSELYPHGKSNDDVTWQNDRLSLAVSEMRETINDKTINMNKIGANQLKAIVTDWGKLQHFAEEVYGKNAPISASDIAIYVAEVNDMVKYQGYTWLFPTKYRVCSQLTSANYDYSSSPGDTVCPAGELKGGTTPMVEWRQGTSGGKRTYYPDKTYSVTCIDTQYLYLCQHDNVYYTPPGEVLEKINGNKYARENGLFHKDKNFAATVLADATHVFRNGHPSLPTVEMNIPVFVVKTTKKSSGTNPWCGVSYYAKYRTDVWCDRYGPPAYQDDADKNCVAGRSDNPFYCPPVEGIQV